MRKNNQNKKKIVVAIGGNPNSGKTSIFNHLTGSHQKVGNWGGVTVEKVEGTVEHKGYEITFVDLPGTYSLTAYSIEEIIARNFIVDEKPDVIVDILDAGNLERNLYLAVQMIEMKGKFIFVLNMADMAKKQGVKIDGDKLATLLGGPVIFTVGNRGIGVDVILDKVVEVYEGKDKKVRHIHIPYGRDIEGEIKKIQSVMRRDKDLSKKYSTRWLSVKLLENDREVIEKIRKQFKNPDEILNQVEESKNKIYKIYREEPEVLIADQRYGFISGLLQEVISLEKVNRIDISQKIDFILTNRVLGIPILIFFIWLMFQVTFGLGAYPKDWIQDGVDLLSNFVANILPEGILKSLVVDGIIGGVGSVIIFLPNILLLFLMISLFEDTGYMARAAFVMDRIMHTMGLHGKSFIPMIMGFGCNVPAIMATRTLENEKDRILTILINPLMSCSARLPVYILIAGAFFGKKAGNVIFSLYAIGIILAVVIGRIFRRTILKGESEPFVMELPPYRIPTLKSVVIHMWDKSVVFLKKMGTIILVGSIIIWFLGNFPINKKYSTDYNLQIKKINMELSKIEETLSKQDPNYEKQKIAMEKKLQNELSKLENKRREEDIEKSFIGIIGKAIEPIFKPLGFSWREGVALITGFVAKEIVVSTLGVLYGAGDNEEGQNLKEVLLAKSHMTPLVAYAFLVFVLIYTPCLATIAAIKRETGSIKWTLFSIGYELSLAWILSFLIVHIGRLFIGG